MLEWLERLMYGYPTLRAVIVNTRTEKTFRGVLWRRRRGYLVLRNAELLRGRGEVEALSGEVMIEAGNVDFVQVV